MAWKKPAKAVHFPAAPPPDQSPVSVIEEKESEMTVDELIRLANVDENGGGGGDNDDLGVTNKSEKMEEPKPPPREFQKPDYRKVTYTSSSKRILTWINTFMESNLTKIEDLGTGVSYCLCMNRLFPGAIPLDRVKYHGRWEADFIHNFRILQNSFNLLRVDKVVPAHKLAKCRFTDNFEFAKWFKQFFHLNYIGQPPYGPNFDEDDNDDDNGGGNNFNDVDRKRDFLDKLGFD